MDIYGREQQFDNRYGIKYGTVLMVNSKRTRVINKDKDKKRSEARECQINKLDEIPVGV